MAFDFKKEYKEFYMPKNKPEIVTVPPANYIAVRGTGDPNEEGGAYKQAIGGLYAVAYTLKMSYKTDYRIEGFYEYVVPPLEGFWWQDGIEGVDYTNKAAFHWISVIRLPDFITRENFQWAVEMATKKKKTDCSSAEFMTIDEGLCVQVMHQGPYDDEPATVALMDEFLTKNGYMNDFSETRLHHEIYLSDARKVAPEKWKTVIRHPIKKLNGKASPVQKRRNDLMEYIRVTKDNLEKEHICCAISNNKDVQVSSKKAWLADRFDEGLVFLKSVERGKCFIEYIPAENAWVPIDAAGYMYIDCLWVSGSFKGHGYSTDLLNSCIEDSKEKGKKGLCILASSKKKPFLADPKFLKHKGFAVSDEADNGIQLWYLSLDKDAEAPKFKECARHPHIDETGYVLYYTSQCPFNAKYVPVLEKTAEENGIPFRAVHIGSREEAQNAPAPVTTYALFRDGEYLTNEQMNDKKFLKLVKGS